MQNLLFKKLILISQREAKARILNFHPKATVLTGDNDTGKSSIIKSLFKTFGAETSTHDEWASANVTSLVQFTVNQTDYFVLRQGRIFTIFDENSQPQEQFSSISKGLGPFLANLFQFGLVLNDKTGQSRTPPPAYFFLPYYFDQDRSWQANWNSFGQLGQLSNWRQDLVEYHTGVRPNEFYKAKGEQGKLQRSRDELLAEQAVLRNIKSQLNEKLQNISFKVNLDDFRDEITQLLVECEKIRETAETVQKRLVQLHNERIDIQARIEIVKQSLKEISADFKFLKKCDSHIECPSCGAEYDNNFKEIFSIAIDEDKCQELLISLTESLDSVKKKIAVESSLHTQHEEAIARIEGILALRREEVQLKDLIEAESKKQVSEVLKEKAESLTSKLTGIQENLDEIKKKLAQLTDKEVKIKIVDQFRRLMKGNLFKLHVHKLSESSYKTMHCKINEQGSDLPRALLAYGFSILNVIHDHTSSVFCPIVIDSPIQQEPDKENHARILTFIRDNRPDDSQLIMAVGDTKGIEFDGDTVLLTEKFSVMNAEQFEEGQEFMEPFLQNSLLFTEQN